MKPGLDALGWGPDFAAQLAAGEAGLLAGRVAFESRGIYRVLLEGGEAVHAELKGILRKAGPQRADYPVVGDWVLLERLHAGRALLLRALKRRNALVRREQARREVGRRLSSLQVLAANVDWGLITSSLNEEWNPRRLERYLGLVREAGARPAVLLTKADLAADGGAAALAATRELAPGDPVLLLSAPRGEGLAALRELIRPGQTAVLLGSSGVGKSTLLNALLGREAMATAEIREKDSRGRHTTVGRHLLPLPWGACLIDSPGLRDLGLVDEAAVEQSFDDIAELSAQCRFSDCRHQAEPGCAVRAALEDGGLDEGRWQAYQKLKTETAAAEKRLQLGGEAFQRQKGKGISRAIKNLYKGREGGKR